MALVSEIDWNMEMQQQQKYSLPKLSFNPLMGFKSYYELKDGEEVREQFIQTLCRRRSKGVPLMVFQSDAPREPLYQLNFTSQGWQTMDSCPGAERAKDRSQFVKQNLILITESDNQGKVPVLVLKLKHEEEEERKPAVVFLHSSYKNKEHLLPLMEAYAARGYVSVSIDSRYHGQRADSKTCYKDALVSAWKSANTMPFIYDTVWDLLRLMDYLTTRTDIDSKRIGITGESLGGMHAWFAAAMDPRYAVAVPVIGVQSFGWAIENDKWQARVASIYNVFEAAREDFGKPSIDSEVVASVWERIAPGLANKFDALYTIPAIAPRPLLILNGKEDPRCPVEGLQECILKTRQVYREAGASERFKFIAEDEVGHELTPSMVREASAWFDKFLKPHMI